MSLHKMEAQDAFASGVVLGECHNCVTGDPAEADVKDRMIAISAEYPEEQT
jgi:hypothetical protein